MDTSEDSKRLYKEAQKLSHGGCHAEALVLFDQLEEAFPSSRKILYNKGLCLCALGRTHEVLTMCDKLDEAGSQAESERLRSHLASLRVPYPAPQPPAHYFAFHPSWRTVMAFTLLGGLLVILGLLMGYYFGSVLSHEDSTPGSAVNVSCLPGASPTEQDNAAGCRVYTGDNEYAASCRVVLRADSADSRWS